jgi:hypothetical protein
MNWLELIKDETEPSKKGLKHGRPLSYISDEYYLRAKENYKRDSERPYYHPIDAKALKHISIKEILANRQLA